MDPRFLRQVILPEIGLAGQERLAGVIVDPGNDRAAAAARRYLQGAGVKLVEGETSPPPEAKPLSDDHSPDGRPGVDGDTVALPAAPLPAVPLPAAMGPGAFRMQSTFIIAPPETWLKEPGALFT